MLAFSFLFLAGKGKDTKQEVMNLADRAISLLAASGGDTVKLFDISMDPPSDPCVLSYTPAPGFTVNSVKWNHTNLVVASAGDDKRISLWRKSGESMGILPVPGNDSGDTVEESISVINFSNKGSRYICSGGTGQIVRIWDLQRKRCIKSLRGHSDTITGVMYNCKDEHLASISLGGDLIMHNLASSSKAAELKDPNQQVLRVLDYSRLSRHLLVTSGDDGSIHLWDTTGRSPKVSWLKQHSAPTAGICFSPSNDKVIVSVGLDKKLCIYDAGSRRLASSISYDTPFSSLAFKDDGSILACGTVTGRVVFYDIRGKPQPLTVLRAYGNSEAINSLCWQRSKPVIVNDNNCSPEMALLGGSADDTIVMPDPLPSVASSSQTLNSVPDVINVGRSSSNEALPFTKSLDGPMAALDKFSVAEETPHRGLVKPTGMLTRLNPRRSSYNINSDMDVFSPVVEVQPITPSLDKLWDGHDGLKGDNFAIEKKSSSLFASANRRFPFSDDITSDHPISDWKSSSTSRQNDSRVLSFSSLGSSVAPTTKVEDTAPSDSWGGERLADKLANFRPTVALQSRFGLLTSSVLTSASTLYNLQEVPSSLSQTHISSITNSNVISTLRNKDGFPNQDATAGLSELSSSSSLSFSLGNRGLTAMTSTEAAGTSLTVPRRSYAERIGATSAFSDGASVSVGSPKVKKTGSESRDELGSTLLSRSNFSNAADPVLPYMNGGSSSFSIQLFQRTLEETLDMFQKSVHEDIRNLHLEILRQFHMQETEFSSAMKSILENQEEMMKEIRSLRKENHELRQLL